MTANDCANILLAIGASPIMADDPEETGEIAAAARALVLNMGTPSRRKLEAMVRAGKRANERGIPVILDPVGAGASALRREMAERLVREVRVDILRGNVSEVSSAAGLSSREKGVDVSEADRGIDRTEAAMAAARRLGCTVAVTGEVDVVTDGRRTARIRGGSSLMARVTGTGCMTSALQGLLQEPEETGKMPSPPPWPRWPPWGSPGRRPLRRRGTWDAAASTWPFWTLWEA